MVLNISERIRDLRRERSLTQEEVARHLGVSPQAVSKWENAVSYPDLELIPPLAELLGVSIDALFREDDQTEAEEYCRKADEMLGDPVRLRGYLPTLREAVIRHPFHAGLLRRLGTALFLSYRLPEDLGKVYVNDQGEENVVTHGDPGLLREAIAAYERALDRTKDPAERDVTVKNLTAAYALADRRDDARRLAQQQSRLAFSREIIMTDAEDGEKKEEAVASALLALMMQTAITVMCGTPGTGCGDAERLIHAQRCISTARFIESFFPDGRCGMLHFVLSQLYYYPAALYAALDEFEKADESFAAMARHEKANREYGEGGEYGYSGPLFGRLTDREPKYVRYEPTKQPFTPEYTAHLKQMPELASLLQ